jgi:hypothetical protein
MKTLSQTGLGLRMPVTPGKRFLIKHQAQRRYFGVFFGLCFLVVIQIVAYANYLIPANLIPIRGIDSFVYSGFIASLPHHLQNFPNTYYGARLPWVLPGYLLTCVFGPFPGMLLLNLVFSLALGLCAYIWFYFLFGFRYGLLLAVVMISLPEVAYQATNHYVSLACSTYTLASLTCIEASLQRWRTRFQRSRLLCLAGAAIACAIMTNLVLVLFLPALMSYYFLRSRGTSIQEVLVDAGGALAGILATIFIFCLAYLTLTGSLNIFGPAVEYLKAQPAVNPWRPVGFGWIEHAMWLILPVVAAFVAITFLFQKSGASSERSKYLALAVANLIAVASFVCMQLLGGALLSLSYYSCMLLPFCLGALIALIGKISSLEKCSRGMLLSALIAASPAGVLLMSSIFREFVLTKLSISATVCFFAVALTLLAFWRPIRGTALVLLLLVAQSPFVRPNGDGRYYLDVPVLYKDIPERLYDPKPALCAPAQFFTEVVRAHNYIYNATGFRAPCFLIEGQPNDAMLADMGISVLSSYLYMYSMLDFSASDASYNKFLLANRSFLAVLGNSAAWRDQQFQRARELAPGTNFVFDSETLLHYKGRVLSLALYKINRGI